MIKSILLFFLLLWSAHLFAGENYITTTDGVELYVKVKGEGPACLLIHGGPGSGSYWMEEFFGDSLEKHFTMIYLDQRGVGRSSSPADGNYSMNRMVRDFEEVRKSLEIDQWLTLGHSFGGLLQMDYVSANPEAISGMLFINCSLSLNDSFGESWLPKAIEIAGDDVPEICLDKSEPVIERMLAIMPVLNEKGNMWRIFFNSEENHQKMNATYAHFSEWNSDFSEKAMFVDDYWKDFREVAKQVTQPVLFFYGKTDWAIGPNHYKNISFPNMLLWGSNVGHMPFLENKEDLGKAVNSFVEQYKF